MKSLTQALQTEKAKANVTTFFLINLGGLYGFTDCNVTINYNGLDYLPCPLQVNGFSVSNTSNLDGGSISFGNITNLFSSLVLNNDLRDMEVEIYEQWFDSANTVIDTEVVYIGKVSGRPSLNEQWCSVTVQSHKNPWTIRTPRRRITKTCGFLFKDGDCKYSGGSTTCNKTYENCTTLSNTANFGGFRFLPARGTKFTWNNTIITIK